MQEHYIIMQLASTTPLAMCEWIKSITMYSVPIYLTISNDVTGQNFKQTEDSICKNFITVLVPSPSLCSRVWMKPNFVVPY